MNNVIIIMLMSTSIYRDDGSDPQLSERVYIQLKSMDLFWLHKNCWLFIPLMLLCFLMWLLIKLGNYHDKTDNITVNLNRLCDQKLLF